MGDTEWRAFSLFADDDARLYRPAFHALADRILQMRHGRKDQFEGHVLRAQLAQRLAEYRHVMVDFAAAASRQHQKNQLLRVAALLLVDPAPPAPDLFLQGVADIDGCKT